MIKNIIFDITNVLLLFKRDYLLGNFYQGEDYDFLKEKIFFDWEKMDEGLLTTNQHLELVKKSLPEKYHDIAEQVLTTWEDYMCCTDATYDFIKSLKRQGYKLYIISNMTPHFIERENKFKVLSLFDGKVYSAPIKLLKPDPAIYEYCLKKYNLKAEESLFIDDLKDNVLGAQKVGIDSFLYKHNLSELKSWIKEKSENSK